MNEALYYAQIARTDYPEDYTDAIEMFGVAGARVAAEQVYIQMHGVVPPWALHIEAFEMVGDDYIFVHRAQITS